MDKYKTIKRLDECDEKEIKKLLIERKGLELLEILTKENFKNNSYKVVE